MKGQVMKYALLSAALLSLVSLPAFSETYEVKMLNKGEAGAMVFEPHFIAAKTGDTVKFIAVDKGHNAETIKGMVPEGQEPFEGKLNEEIDVQLTAPGMIGVKCKPHLGMGMVMVIQVDGAEAPADFLEAKMPGKAKKTFEKILSEVH
jgi:pseudoazurin